MIYNSENHGEQAQEKMMTINMKIISAITLNTVSKEAAVQNP